MSDKKKSFLYFASFILAALAYYNVAYTSQTVEIDDIANVDVEKTITEIAQNQDMQ